MSPQNQAIIEYLKTGESLTVAEALTKLGVYALSQRIGEIRREYPVVSERVTTPSGKHISRYRLIAV